MARWVFCCSVFLLLCVHQAYSAPLIKSLTLARTYNPKDEGWFNLNHPMVYYDPSMYDSMINRMKQLPGLTSVRIPIHWAFLERSRGQLDATYLSRLDATMNGLNASSISVVGFFVGSPTWITSDPNSISDTYPPLDYQAYVDRALWLIARYQAKGLVGLQVWNEVNLPGFWSPVENVTAYGDLYQRTCDAVKANTSHVKCYHAGMAYYSQMPNNGGNFMFSALNTLGKLSNVPAVAYHPYFNRPEGNDNDGKPTDFLDDAAFINTNLKTFTSGAQIWAGETGWSTYNTSFAEQPFITELEQADYLIRRLLLLGVTSFDRVFLFALYDFPTGLTGSARDEKYGIIDENERAKPAFNAVKFWLSNFFFNTARALTSPCQVSSAGLNDTTIVYSVSFVANASSADPKTVLFVWSPSAFSGSISVTCSSVSSTLVGRIIDMVTQQTLGYAPVSQSGVVNVPLGAWTRAVVFESAPSPASSSVSPPTSSLSPVPSPTPVGVRSPLSSQNANSAASGTQIGVAIICLTTLLTWML